MTKPNEAQRLAAYGADPARWPEESEPPSTELRASAAWREALALDQALERVPWSEPPPGLLEAVLPPRRWEWLPPEWSLLPVWRLAAPVLVSLLLGVAVGWQLPGPEPPQAGLTDNSQGLILGMLWEAGEEP